MGSKRRFTCAFAVAVIAVGSAGASMAHANTYCAKLNAGDLPGYTCDASHTGSATAVALAVQEARNNPGPDRVVIGPGQFTSPTSIDLNGSGTDNAMEVFGQGDSTVLSINDPAAPSITFDSGSGSTFGNLAIKVPDFLGGTPKEALIVRNSFDGKPPTIHDLTLTVDGPNPWNLTGITLYSGSDLDNVSVDVSSALYSTTAVKAQGDESIISGSRLKGRRGVSQDVSGGSLSLIRTRVEAMTGATNWSGTLNITDSLIQTPAADGQVAVQTIGHNAYETNTSIISSTVVSRSGDGATITANTGSAKTRLTLLNSVVTAAGADISADVATAGDSATVRSDYSAYDVDEVVHSGAGTFIHERVDSIDLDATAHGFVDVANSDFSLTAGSPLIDAGDPTHLSQDSRDLGSNPRACHGKDDGVIRRDIGAFEFKTDPEDDCTYPITYITGFPQSPTVNPTPSFVFATDKNPGTYLCSWNSQPEAPCAFNAKAPNLGIGVHSVSVRTKDRFGNIDQTPEVHNYEVKKAPDPEPTCETDPSLCPKPPADRKAPKVTGLKFPKKTKAKRVKVRFKSNEKGVTFTCKLNKAKARKCKSPWRTPKLRKGKNTFAIQATDKAGNRSKVVKRVIRRK